MPNPTGYEYLFGLVWSLGGSLARFCSEELRKKFSWKMFAGRLAVGAFVGLMFFEVCQNINPEWARVAAGLGGAAGAEGMTALFRLIKKRVGLDEPETHIHIHNKD